MFVGLKYHIVRASDGFHMVPKSTAKLGSVYSDVRTFAVRDWEDRRELLFDITQSNNHLLKEEAARSAIGNEMGRAWNSAVEGWLGSDLP